jgi:hypothetical protein
MPYRIEWDPETEYVNVILHGDVGIEDIRGAREAAWKLADGEGLRGFLTEFQDARLDVDTQDIVTSHKHFEAIGMRRYIKSALLVPMDAEIAQDATVHEYMARMNMWQVRVFFDRAQALEWLLNSREEGSE